MIPVTPFPTSLSPRGQAALQKEWLGKAYSAIPHPGNEPHAWFFPGAARTALGQGKRLQSVEAVGERTRSRIVQKQGGWDGRCQPSPRSSGVSLVLRALGHSDTVIHTWELPMAPWWRDPCLASSRVLQGYQRGP